MSCVLHWTFANESLQAYFSIFVALAVVPLFLHRDTLCFRVQVWCNIMSICLITVAVVNATVRFLHINVIRIKHSNMAHLSRC